MLTQEQLHEGLEGFSELVQEVLSDDLRKPKYRGHPNKWVGHCYVACELLYHLAGKVAGYKPYVVRTGEYVADRPDDTHWFLKNPETGRQIDPTAKQFENGVNPMMYKEARCCGFLTKEPSKRAEILRSRLVKYLRGNSMISND